MRPAILARALAALLALPALSLPAAAQGAEEIVMIESGGQIVVGTLRLPEGEPAPVVLLLHGFNGTRDELPVTGTEEGVFSRTARLLAEAGYASLRIDFRGSGASDGEFADTTFEGQVQDGLAALRWLAEEPRVDAGRLGLIGWSQGGLVASAVAGRSDGAVDAAALWAAVADPEATFGGLLGEETLQAGLATGTEPLKITLPWGAEVALRAPFFEGVATFDPLAEIAAYPGPLFLAHGSLDTTVPPAQADAFIAAHEGPEELWLREMDHVFNAFTGPEMLDEMVAATAAFLGPHLD